MEMKRVLRVIVIRSGILLTLLVVLIVSIKTLVQHGPPEITRSKLLAVVKGDDLEENVLQIRGIRDGIAYNGLKYSMEEFQKEHLVDPNNKRSPNIVYCMAPCLTEEILIDIQKEGVQFLIGYSFIDKPQKSLINIYAGLDWKDILPIYQKIIPGLETLGIVYTEGSCDGENQVNIIKEATASEDAIKLIIRTLDHHVRDIKDTFLALGKEADAIYLVARDRIIQENFETILKISLENKIPLLGGGLIGPQEGTVASVAHNPYRIGRKSTEIIREFEKDSKAAGMGIVYVEPELYLNITSAYSLGLIIPSDIRKKARQVYD